MSATHSWLMAVKFHAFGQVGINAESMIGIGGHHELATAHRQQIVLAHHAPDLFLPHHETGPLDERSDAPVPIAAMLHCVPLDGIPQCHFCLARRLLLPVAIKARTAHPRQLAHPLDRHFALRFPAADLVVDAVPPSLSFGWRNPSTLRKALLKKLTSKLRRPNSPSKLATSASNSRTLLACGSSAAAGCPCRAASR